jgi:predicted ATPase/class 3 adenylate cyclase/predicted Ser/Thr protein kinase
VKQAAAIRDLTLIYESDRSKIFTAEAENEGLVILKDDKTGDLSRVHNEAIIGAYNNFKKLSSVFLFNGRTLMMREFIPGKSVSEMLAGKAMELAKFLDLAIKMSNELQHFHQSGLLHKDVNPKNIIVTEFGDVHLIDFEFGAAIIQQEMQFEPLPLLVGTVEYISPEQTGRMNRKVDHRSDYYSLGATFYEMLTGRPPFQGTDVLALIHSQLAIAPKAPSVYHAKVPRVLDAIILKLLAKNAEERYQSISGLLLDLNRCATELAEHGEISNFEPGKTDIAARLVISQKLYGREAEVNTLQHCFALARQGGKVLVQIGGYSGVGKSTLCQELYKTVSSNKGIYLSGGFDILDRQTPYLAWSKAFRQFADWLIAEEKSIQQYWRERLNQHLKGLGNIIIEMAPNFKFVLPKQPELEQLHGFENQQRIHFAINAFLQSLASSEHPLVLFLDDYQWADDASFDLLRSVCSNYGLTNILILIAYRDNEVDHFHPLVRGFAKIKEHAQNEGTQITEFTLRPLTNENVQHLLADTLHLENENVADLSELVFEKTKGNAFSINRLLDSLYSQKLVQFDYHGNSWVWDLERIKAQNLSENIVELLLLRIKELSEDSLRQIKAGAVFGLQFSLEQVSLITGLSPSQVHTLLWPLIQDGSILPLGNDYHFLPAYYQEINRDVRFRFAHPRLQQAVYELLSAREQSRFHFDVGQILLHKLPPAEVEERAIEVAHHFEIGYAFVEGLGDKSAIGNLLLQAGKKAGASASFDVALTFTEKAFLVLKLAKVPEIGFQTMLHLLEYSYLAKMEDKQKIFEREAQTIAKTNAEKAAVYEVVIRCLGFANRQKEAVELTRKALAEFGIRLPEKAKTWQIITAAIGMQIKLPSKRIGSLEQIKEIENSENRELIRIMQAAAASYFFVNIETYPLLIFHMVARSLKYGYTAESASAFASYGLILAGAMKKLEDGYTVVQESFKFLERPGTAKYASTIYMIHAGFTAYIKDKPKDCLALAEAGYQKGLETGNMEYASWNILHTILIKMTMGADMAEMLKQSREIIHFQRQYNYGNQVALTEIKQNTAKVLGAKSNTWQSELQDYNACTEPDLAKAKEAKNDIYLLTYYGDKGSVNILYKQYEKAFEFFNVFAIHAKKQITSLYINLYKYQHTAAACHLLLQGITSVKGVKLRAFVFKQIKELKKFEKLNPALFSGLVNALDALIGYLNTKTLNREKFETSIEQLEQSGLAIHALQLEDWYAELLRSRGDGRFETYLNRAVLIAQQLKMPAKERMLLGYSESAGVKLATSRSSAKISSEQTSFSLDSTSVDVQTLIKSIDALVNEIKLEDLLGKLLTYAMENTGAQEGFFLVNRAEEWNVEVSIRVDDGMQITFPRESLKQSKMVSESIVNYAMNTLEPIVIANAKTELPFSNDAFVQERGILSVMCIPFINQNKISGIIYLSHSQSTDAFRKDHINLMRLMAGQIATNIENALLYENLENLVEVRTQQLELEKQKSEELLLNILPKEVAEELKINGKASANYYPSVSVMFIDFKDFTVIAEGLPADQLVRNLDEYFGAFDDIISDYNLEKIKTIGDCYMVAGGIPVVNESHCLDMINAACALLDFVNEESRRKKSLGLKAFTVRIGVHTGSVVAGVVGKKKFAYDIWGDAVNIAARMEQNSEVGKINITEDVYEQIKHVYNCTYRGEIAAKNKGNLKMYFVEGKQ